MKKALQISIAKTLFTIEDDAYAVLDTYIASVKEHFDATEGKDEIIADIESRIAEQLLETKEQVISIATVEKVIAVMGKVEDFDDKENIGSNSINEHNQHEANGSHNSQTKKLYRNPDNQYIGGVASGMAEYFGIDPMWPRLVFVLVTLMNGIGIIIYVIFWIVLPEAKTKSQKLEMKGAPVTLNTLSSKVNERISNMDKSGSLRKLIALPFQILGKVLRTIIYAIGPIFRIGTGIVFVLGGMAALVGIVVFSGFILSDSVLIIHDVTLSSLLPGGIHWFVIGGFALAAIIPTLAVLISGISLLQKRSIFTRNLSLGFLGVWLLALLVSGFGIAKIISNIETIEATSPSQQIVNATISLVGFDDANSATNKAINKLMIEDGLRVTVLQGTSTSLIAHGKARSIESVKATVTEGTLKIERNRVRVIGNTGANATGTSSEREKFCMFCSTEMPELTLTVPSLSEVTIQHGADMLSDSFPTSAAGTLLLTAEHGSYVNISLNTGATLQSFNASSTHGSNIYVKGTAKNANLYAIHGSRILGEDFTVQTATTSAAHGSRIEIDVLQTLNAKAIHGSYVRYGSSPVISEETAHGSQVESVDGY